ncbi:hypothetical protein MHYP_G00299870 [Metynnis hypsauchen]
MTISDLQPDPKPSTPNIKNTTLTMSSVDWTFRAEDAGALDRGKKIREMDVLYYTCGVRTQFWDMSPELCMLLGSTSDTSRIYIRHLDVDQAENGMMLLLQDIFTGRRVRMWFLGHWTQLCGNPSPH